MITMDVDEIKDAIRLALVREVKRKESFIQGGRKFDGRIMSINKLRIEYSDVGYGCPMYDIDGSWLAELRISTPVRDIDSEGEEERTYMTEWNDYHAIMLDGVVQECDVIVPIKLAAEYLFEWSEVIIRR